MKSLLLRVCAVCFNLLLLACAITPAWAAAKTLTWARLDCDINVQPNGDLKIVETNVIDFTSGSFTFGYRDIDQSRLTSIRDISVTENGKPLRTETSVTDHNDFRIKYYFPSAQNEEREFVLSYTVIGATRYYTTGDEIYWAAVYAARNGFPVQQSRVTVSLPEGAAAINAVTFGANASVTGQGESKVVANAQDPIPSGKQLEILVSFPHGIIGGSSPAWQGDYDAQQTQKLEGSKNDVLFLLLSLLLLFGGPAFVVVLWFAHGRDPNVGMIAEYLNEPPPDIKPGIAGTLVDVSADLQDIIATIVDLARRGVLTMQENATYNPAGIVTTRDYILTQGPAFTNTRLSLYETRLLEALELAGTHSITMSQVQNKLAQRISYVKASMYQELLSQGYYTHDPQGTHKRYSTLGIGLMILAVVGFCLATGSSTSALLICMPGGIFVTGIAFLIASGFMDARTRKGAEMKMRLEAFKRYLQHIEKYTDVKSATDLFDKYLPYAIAFSLDRTWVQKFAAVNTPAPAWYIPSLPGMGTIPDPVQVTGGGLGNVLAKPVAGGIEGAAVAHAPVTLEGVNQGLASGLSDVNKSLTTMFSSVSASLLGKSSSVGGAVASVAKASGSTSSDNTGMEIAGAVIGAVIDIAVGGGGSSGGGGGGFG